MEISDNLMHQTVTITDNKRLNDNENVRFDSVYFDGKKSLLRTEDTDVPKIFDEKDVVDLEAVSLGQDSLKTGVSVSSLETDLKETREKPEDLLNKEKVNQFFADDEQNAQVKQARTETSDVQTSYQMHSLSAAARRSRDRVIRSLSLKEGEKEELLNSDKQLDQIVNSYVEGKDKKRIAKETKDHLKRFWDLKEAITKDPLLSVEDKAMVLYNYARTFAADVAVYKSIYVSELSKGKREVGIEMYIDRLEGLLDYFETDKKQGQLLTVMGLRHGTANKEFFEKDNGYVLDKARQKAKHIDQHNDEKQAKVEELKKKKANEGDELPEEDHEDNLLKEDKQEKEQEKEKKDKREPESEEERIKRLDASLSKEQMIGIAAADKWLIGLGTHSEKRLPFINRIMALSARERLFIYRMVETGHLDNPNILDLTISQTDYVPSVTTLSFKLYRVPFRLWEKVGKEGMVAHHWNKLEAAFSVVTGETVRHLIDALVENGYEESSKKEEDKNGDILDGVTDEELKRDAENVKNLADQRNEKLDEAIKAVEECEKALKKRDSAWIKKKKKAEVANEKTDEALRALSDLMRLDEQLFEAIDQIKYKSGYTAENAKGDIIGYAGYAAGQALGVLGKCSNIPKLFATDIVKTSKIAEFQNTTAMVGNLKLEGILNAVNTGTAAFTTAKGMLGIYSSLKGLKKILLTMASGDLSKTDRAFIALQYVYGLGASATAAGLGATSLAYAGRVTQSMMSGSKTAIAGMSQGVLKTSAALAATGLVVNGIDLMIQKNRIEKRMEADDQIEKLRKTEKLKGDDDCYMKGIQKLDTRNKAKKAVGTAFSAVTNTGNLLILGAGPVGSLAWAGISLGISLAGRLTDYLLQERSQKKTAEEFLQLNDITDLLDTVDADVVRNLKKSGKKMEQIKTSLMNHMSAELGFVTFKSFFAHIVGKYAQFLFLNLFYDNGTAILKGNEQDHSVSGACAQLLKGMGLRVKFPTSDDEDKAQKQRHPSLRAIASKLGG